MRYLITFSYDGSEFCGYQRQPKKKTIQGELERALTEINNNVPVTIQASVRTDAKVHAICQKAHFDIDVTITKEKLKQALNGLISRAIHINEVSIVDEDFHARYHVTEKEYMYILNTGEYNPFERNYVNQYGYKLDVNKMKDAIVYLLGEHNFKSFSKADSIKDSYVRTITMAYIETDKEKIIFHFKGDGFFQYMIRNMVGTLMEVGQGKREPNEIVSILNAMDRRSAGRTANPEGLYLVDVNY